MSILWQKWNLILRMSRLGINPDMPAAERRAVGLVNRISLLALAVFMTFGIVPSLIFGHLEHFPIDLANLLMFSIPLWLNHKGKYTLAKHTITAYGSFIIPVVVLLMGPESGALFNYFSIIIIPVMIYRSRKIIFAYYLFNLTSFVLVTVYHARYGAIAPLEAPLRDVAMLINVGVNVFVIGFFVQLFYKGLQEEYERTLVRQNRQLEKQKTALAAQHDALHQTHERLKRAQSQLVQTEKMASLGQLTAGLAHEINNPINYITSSTYPLRRNIQYIQDQWKSLTQLLASPQDPLQQEELKRMLSDEERVETLMEIDTLIDSLEEGAKRTHEIVAGLRNFSRLDEDVWKEVDIHEGLNTTLKLLTHRLKDHIHVHRAFRELPPVHGRPGQLNQVFMNVLLNAIEAIERHPLSAAQGNIYIHTDRITANGQAMVPEQHSREQHLAHYVCIHIRDTGCGITPEVQARMFDPFFTTKEVGSGMGLGLSIAYSIVREHEGHIHARSHQEGGCELTIALPERLPIHEPAFSSPLKTP